MLFSSFRNYASCSIPWFRCWAEVNSILRNKRRWNVRMFASVVGYGVSLLVYFFKKRTKCIISLLLFLNLNLFQNWKILTILQKPCIKFSLIKSLGKKEHFIYVCSYNSGGIEFACLFFYKQTNHFNENLLIIFILKIIMPLFRLASKSLWS